MGERILSKALSLHHIPAHDGSKDIVALAGESNTHQQDWKQLTQDMVSERGFPLQKT